MRCRDCDFYQCEYMWNKCTLTDNEYYHEFYDEQCNIIDDNYTFTEDCGPMGFVKGKSAKEFMERDNMTREEAIKMLKAELKCMERASSGQDVDCNSDNCDNCDLCYLQGNWEEQKEYLKLSIKALKQPEIIYCKDCKKFMEYSDKYKQTEKADGDCFNLKINTDNSRLIKKKFYDYCSYAERKDD